MCGRTVTPASQEIINELNLKLYGEPQEANINLKPTNLTPVIANNDSQALQYFKWSVIPHFSKDGKADPKYSTFNAKIESLIEPSALWKPLLAKQQFCVHITKAFYEWNWLD